MSTTAQQEQQEQHEQIEQPGVQHAQAQLSGLAADELGNITPKSLDWSDADLIALDLETTGLKPEECEIIDIGMAKVIDGKIVDEYSQLIYPGVNLAPVIVQLTHISDSDLVNQPTLGEVFPTVRKLLGNRPLLGHNVSFDQSFLQAAAERFLLPSVTNKLIDTMLISRDKFPQERRHRLQDVMTRLGIIRVEKHRALSDAKDTLDVYNLLEAMPQAR